MLAQVSRVVILVFRQVQAMANVKVASARWGDEGKLVHWLSIRVRVLGLAGRSIC